ncbi:V-set domain-containing T-cell activation inhibitor 1-like [Sander lucioperca]|uniref:V-set domain-containing T-cell activation inhibitor 1-like n=1 Tax=Sander lucioperca TaxID=283035 RepID=UPI00125CF3CD|nr:V-set domain-containing T-cell activation inhibitor 1-like [Sander lucioperca]
MNLMLPMWLVYLAVKSGTGQSNVTGSNETVRAVVGHDATLPCHLEPPFDVTTLIVVWKRDGIVVHVHRNGYVAQHENFRNRTSLFHDEMAKGNISLKLTNVTKLDEGNYTCQVPTLQSKVMSGNVTLIVGECI